MEGKADPSGATFAGSLGRSQSEDRKGEAPRPGSAAGDGVPGTRWTDGQTERGRQAGPGPSPACKAHPADAARDSRNKRTRALRTKPKGRKIERVRNGSFPKRGQDLAGLGREKGRERGMRGASRSSTENQDESQSEQTARRAGRGGRRGRERGSGASRPQTPINVQGAANPAERWRRGRGTEGKVGNRRGSQPLPERPSQRQMDSTSEKLRAAGSADTHQDTPW